MRVLIVAEQRSVRRRTRVLLEASGQAVVVGETHEPGAAADLTRALRPDVVLVDAEAPWLDGVEATRRIVLAVPDPRPNVLIIGASDDPARIAEALRAGARGYILRQASPAAILSAARAVAQGNTVFGPWAGRRVRASFAERGALAEAEPAEKALRELTRRERDVFDLMAAGRDARQIASLLVLGESTVRSHVQRVYRKLCLRSQVELVIFAYENGLLAQEPA